MGIAILLLKTKLVQMNPRYEKSLLDVFAKNNEPDDFKPIDPTYTWLTQQAAEIEKEDAQKKQMAKISMYEAIGLEQSGHKQRAVQESGDGMIRFVCPCGKRIKVAAKYAGKAGKCPRCKKRVKIPEKG